MTSLTRDQLIELYSKAQFSDNFTKGQITVDSPRLVQSLTLAFENKEISGFTKLTGSAIQLNQSYDFYYDLHRRAEFGHIFKTFDELIQNKKFRADNTSKHYVLAFKYDYKDTNKPETIQKYEKLLSFIHIMKEAAAFVDSSNSKMLFLNDNKQLEVEPIYKKSDLDQLQQDQIDQIVRFINEDTHKKQKLAILSKAIITESSNESFDKIFSVLLSKLGEIYKTLDHDYTVFASSFSYEKLRNEIENAKLEEQVKIHKVITDIQNQILGIPVATVIVATQFKTQKLAGNDLVYQFWVNTGIFVGVMIFSVFLWYLIKNQKDSLVGIETEIDRKDRVLQKTSDVYEKIKAENGNKAPFSELMVRIKTQKTIFTVVQWVTVIATIVTYVIYLFITVFPY
ncbi:hypothetical protein F7P73_02840 [Acinetobacter bohemicus]|uniref:Uncharacterized protein n=1 Tax=Acinetobacter bohemicus TaxID=1435036 RepID=A0A1I6UG93_9GAMM|nr:hypothetical protein [Acinetobacter bohemicus]KAB0654284.1 hypothetical protein F7P73_02840 [Acinetobacter bohemicus]SFT00465.1 hypothetical protein SAMN05444586_10166 [Acinetobacter bohemicus]